MTIGATCDDAAVDHLIAYYEEEIHTQTYREQFLLKQAKGNTLLGLGYCVATTKSQRALNYLQLSLKKGRLEVAKKSVAPGEDIDDHQLNRAVLGLTVAGTQESVRILEDYQLELTRRTKDAPKDDYVHREAKVVSSRLKGARRIQEIGIEAYYDE